uniref:PET hydrolase/cutinase-like domain-containing protein n=1 Tax=Aureoumbra lagunensis TaxID=44058 RepID=A0A6S8C2M4_9STRA|mmetsp:Transcript_2203/g.2917  ORF Transcript_2203/g.2917 Transcript_2203/m.2917 type:complete len:258 (+) Transcript_2203:89-862(+)
MIRNHTILLIIIVNGIMGFRNLQVIEDELSYKALIHMPKIGTNDNTIFPLLLYLHGAGEFGTDLRKLIEPGTKGTPCHELEFGTAVQALQEDFIVVAPQESAYGWNPEKISKFIQEFLLVKLANKIDTRKIYITGHSLGGSGALLIAAATKKFAACVPVAPAGGVPPHRLYGIPIWLFHGTNDLVVPSHYSEHLYKTLYASGQDVQLTLYPDAPTPPGWETSIGHASTIPAYATEDLYLWLLSRQLPADRTPFHRIN